MKFYGKKLLALILALSMVMSVCVFADDTDGTDGESTTPPAVESVTVTAAKSTLIVGETTTIEVVALPEGAPQTFTAEVTGDAVTVSGSTVTAVKAGTATVTVTAGEKTDTCDFTVVADEITAIAFKTDADAAYAVPYGVAFSASKLNGIKLTATYGAAGTKEITADSWTLVGEALGTAVGSSATYKATVAKLAESVEAPTVTVTVEKAVVSENVKLDSVTVPLNIQGEKAMGQLPTDITVKLQDGSSKTLKIGTELEWAPVGFATAAAGTYNIPAKVKEAYEDKYEIGAGKTISVDIIVSSALTTDKVTASAVVDSYSDSLTGLHTKLNAAIKAKYGIEVGTAAYTYTGIEYGSVSSTGTYAMSLTTAEKTSLQENGYLKDTFTAAVVADGVTYTVPVELTIYYNIFDTSASFDYKGASLSTLATAISNRLNTIYGKTLYAIAFEYIDDDGGDLYEKNTCEDYVDTDYSYSASEMSSMFYLPNGTGEYSVLSYVARTSTSGQSISGEIQLKANEFILLTGEITSDETLDFDADDILGAIFNADDEFEVNYVKFTSLPSTSSQGTLYYEYDADKTSNTKVTTSKSYYVDATGTQAELTNFTYVPKKTASGVAEIVFKAYKTSTKSMTVVIRLNVVEEADITVAVGKGETAELDLEWFYDIVKEYASTTAKKKYEIAYIVFNGAPATKSEGYLYVDGDKVTSPDGKKFYAYDSDDGYYAFDDTVFVGGNTVKTTRATFSVYGRAAGSTSNPVVLVSNRTIDFVVGTSNIIENPNNPLKAAQVLSFGNELSAFVNLGDNSNVCIEFTSLPQGAKLYYNYGLPTQEDVTVGTKYYTTNVSGEKLLKNVTFVPSYSSDKFNKVISFGMKGHAANGKTVIGAANISVAYAYASAYFSDITTSVYADSVDFLKNQGITTGVPGGKYDAAGSLTRAQVVTFLYRAAGSPAVSGTTTFKDIVKDEYYYNAVLWASQTGVTSGRSATVFDPNATVTNAEVIQFMYNFDVKYLKHTAYVNGSTSYVYDYNQVGDWAQTAVKWAIGKEVLTSGYLYPATVGTRGNIALYLHRMLTL